jgi:hypothetical protein
MSEKQKTAVKVVWEVLKLGITIALSIVGFVWLLYFIFSSSAENM